MNRFFTAAPFVGLVMIACVAIPTMHKEAETARAIGVCFDRGLGAQSVVIPGTFYRIAWVCTK